MYHEKQLGNHSETFPVRDRVYQDDTIGLLYHRANGSSTRNFILKVKFFKWKIIESNRTSKLEAGVEEMEKKSWTKG